MPVISWLDELTKNTDKSQWVKVSFCFMFMDGETEKRVKVYRSKSIANREINKWLKKSTINFCRSYEYGTEQWFIHQTL
jgi:hypothetical protein